MNGDDMAAKPKNVAEKMTVQSINPEGVIK
jgi:hypothetical protein